jgi:hypothetical protein
LLEFVGVLREKKESGELVIKMYFRVILEMYYLTTNYNTIP